MIRSLPLGCLLVIATVSMLGPAPAGASGKLMLYVERMEPYGQDAEDFSRAAWGGGLGVVAPLPFAHELLAGVGGLEVTNFLSETVPYYDQVTGLRVEQQTDQWYARFYLGGRFGPNKSGFLRPHFGANLALVYYDIGTDVVVPDDTDREREIRQHLRDRSEVAAGYDLNAGVDLNFRDKFSIELGTRFLQSFNVPEQLGEGSVQVQPRYLQFYLGAGLSFNLLKHLPDD